MGTAKVTAARPPGRPGADGALTAAASAKTGAARRSAGALVAAGDGPDVADRRRRVGNLDALRLGVHRVLRLDDAEDGRRDGRVAEHDGRLARLNRLVVVVDLDRRESAGAVHLNHRHVVAGTDGRELGRQLALRLG